MNPDQPKPTGEWTDYEAQWLCKRGWATVKDRHNAALAAEQKRADALANDYVTLRSELAAEREKVQTLVDALAKVDLCLERIACRHGMNYDDRLDIKNIRDAIAKLKEKP